MGSRRYRAQEDTGEDQPTHERVPSRLPKRQRRDALSAAPSLPSITRIKGKLRDVKRTLERSKSLPADVRIEKERELAGYKIDLEQAESEKRKQQMIKKYHMVRFFERQKATRKLKRLKKLLSKTEHGSEEHLDLDNKVHRAQVDLNYTLFCPLSEKYTSLYKCLDAQNSPDVTMQDSTASTQGSQDNGPKPAMWSIVEQCMANNTLEELREGKLNGIILADAAGLSSTTKAPKVRLSQKTRSKKAGSKHSSKALLEAEHGESDEGFFEE